VSLIAAIHVSKVDGKFTAHISMPGRYEATFPVGEHEASEIADEIDQMLARHRKFPLIESGLPPIESR